MKHLENNLLYEFQHNFQHNKSCETQLVSFINNLAKSYNNGKQTFITRKGWHKRHSLYKVFSQYTYIHTIYIYHYTYNTHTAIQIQNTSIHTTYIQEDKYKIELYLQHTYNNTNTKTQLCINYIENV